METWHNQVRRILRALYVLTEGYLERKEEIDSVFIESGVTTDGLAGTVKSLQEMGVMRMRSIHEYSLTAHGIDLVEDSGKHACVSKKIDKLDEDSVEMCRLMLQANWERYLVLSSVDADSKKHGLYARIVADERKESEDDPMRAATYLLEKNLLELRGGRMRLTADGRAMLDHLNMPLRDSGPETLSRDRYQSCLLETWKKGSTEVSELLVGEQTRIVNDVQTSNNAITYLPIQEDLVYCKAITQEGIVELRRSEYRKLSLKRKTYEVFIDGFTRRVYRHRGRATRLTPKEFDMISEYVETGKLLIPKRTKSGSSSASREAARKLFTSARKKIDRRTNREQWRLFRTHRASDSSMTAFQFIPPEDSTFCLIVPVREDESR